MAPADRSPEQSTVAAPSQRRQSATIMKTSPRPHPARCEDFQRDLGITPRSALIARKQLTALEEARAVRAMLQRGLSEDGAAQALGWAKARDGAREDPRAARGGAAAR